MKYLLTFTLSLLCFAGFNQDLHFSQFYNSPLTINPALAGQKDAEYRANLNYRGQWQTIDGSRGIATFAASADARILQESVPKYDKLGVGLQLFHDSAGEGYYNTTSVAPTVSYHKALGWSHKLSVGLQPGFSNVGIDFSQLEFENQYIGIGFDRSLPTGENFATNSVNHLDLGAGALYAYRDRSETWNAFVGGALFHLNKPDINFIDGTVYERPVRAAINAGATMELKNGFVVSPGGLYMKQAGASELTIGTLVGKQLGNPYAIGDSKSVYAGAYWREGDAIIGKAGLQWNNMQVGLSGDFATSDISQPLGLNSALELSFTLLGLPDNDNKPIYCPSF